MTVRLAVDPWDPSYGNPLGESALEESTARLTLDLEVPADDWTPICAGPDAWTPDEVLVVDGVRRSEARVWFSVDGEPVPYLGLAASWAAGVARLDGTAKVVDARIGRAIFTACPKATDLVTPFATYPIVHCAGADLDALTASLQGQMRDLELVTANAVRSSDNDLLVVDGPLHGRTSLPRTIGYIKTHQAAYLPTELNGVVAALGAGERTPVFTIGTTWSRHTWYLKLPTPSQAPWAGVVRLECSDSLSREEAVELAEASTQLLPRLASSPHKDPRAPQNLVPIGGLEKALRHRLGDSAKLHRGLSQVALGTR